ncbi:MAG: ORF6N domain-containing protein [Candidatus Desulfaltia sp.]|nr:ORF6N domain-containing protein [Candidatus Desulfaltia sp.]
MMEGKALIPIERIENVIIQIREHKVIIDTDLAKIYGVTTRKLNQAIKRNIDRFPPDFLFQLTQKEKEEVITICDHLENLKYSPYLPFAFTEHGAIMAASVLNSERAIHVSVYIVRAFVKLREMVSTHKELALKLLELEQRLESHDEQIQAVFEAIQQLMTPPAKPRKKIGFVVKEKQAAYGRRSIKHKKG